MKDKITQREKVIMAICMYLVRMLSGYSITEDTKEMIKKIDNLQKED